MQKQHKLLGLRNAYQLLEISDGHFCRLIEKHNIPFLKVARGRVFFEEDINILKEARKKKEEPVFTSLAKQHNAFSYRAAGKYVGVSHSRFLVLVKNYDIPFQQTSCGKIFFEADLKAFMESEKRVEKMKHGRKD